MKNRGLKAVVEQRAFPETQLCFFLVSFALLEDFFHNDFFFGFLLLQLFVYVIENVFEFGQDDELQSVYSSRSDLNDLVDLYKGGLKRSDLYQNRQQFLKVDSRFFHLASSLCSGYLFAHIKVLVFLHENWQLYSCDVLVRNVKQDRGVFYRAQQRRGEVSRGPLSFCNREKSLLKLLFNFSLEINQTNHDFLLLLFQRVAFLLKKVPAFGCSLDFVRVLDLGHFRSSYLRSGHGL